METRTKAVVLVLLAASAAAAAAQDEPIRIDNTDCIALNDPYPCCSGGGTGSCDDKLWFPGFVKREHQASEFCASFWYDLDCDDERNGVQWLVANGACTQGEADAGSALDTVACTEPRAEDGWCKANHGCEALDDPWGCCTGLDTGDCPVPNDAASAPNIGDCRAAFWDEMVRLWKATRRQGQLKWYRQDVPQFVPDDDAVD